MTKTISAFVLFCFVLASAIPALADQITLKNGDRVTGTVVSRSEDKIEVETEYAGVIKIDAAMVEKITPEPAKDANAAADASPTAAKQPDAPAKAVEPKKEVKAVPLFGEGRAFGLLEGWTGNATIGYNYASGNSKTATLTTSLRAVKEGGKDKLTVYARSLWFSSRKSGTAITTSNAFWGGARYDRNVDHKLFGFVSYDFERDRPKKLIFRSIVGAGVGHHTIKNDRTELDLLSGIAWNRTWQADEKTDTPEGLAGATLKQRFNGRLKFQGAVTFFQNITDVQEYRFITDSTVSVDVTKRVGVFFTVGNRFNNDPPRNTEKNDFLFTTGLKWNFGKAK
ncbi:MAG: hypothetical protein UZ17_ACD001001617 [Acidobacteria bacterium OLB17]|nr:MAG: hypothetical protein UZ17_ACD001001617 [Acidobacteria bacterium OLB17]MCZ2390231.1 DUF481 domain-containing protein [Acidobacteriota bacterium]